MPHSQQPLGTTFTSTRLAPAAAPSPRALPALTAATTAPRARRPAPMSRFTRAPHTVPSSVVGLVPASDTAAVVRSRCHTRSQLRRSSLAGDFKDVAFEADQPP